jgi:hypothetical protein
VLVACGCTQAAAPATPGGDVAMSYPNYEPTANSPRFGDDEFGIKAEFAGGGVRATLAADQPWIVAGAYRVGKDVLDEFGQEVNPNVVVIVTHKETRAIYTGRILKDDPPGRRAESGHDEGGEMTALSSFFNIDLKAQCRVRPAPGRYWAVFLVGTLASPVLQFDVK